MRGAAEVDGTACAMGLRRCGFDPTGSTATPSRWRAGIGRASMPFRGPLSAHALFARRWSSVILDVGGGVVEVPEPRHGRVTESFGELLQVGDRSDTRQAANSMARLSRAPFTDRLVNKFGLRVEGWRGSADPAITMIDTPA